MSNCCGKQVEPVKPSASGCCGSDQASAFRPDYFLIVCLVFSGGLYAIHLFQWDVGFASLTVMSHAVAELINTMWWSVLVAMVFVGLISQVPQRFVVSILGKGGTFKGIWRATLAGVLMDLCSHGILMVGMKLYQKGASLGQVMAFLIASPWNSISLTLILIALIGLPWTIAFIVISMVLGITTGLIFDALVKRKVLYSEPVDAQLPDGFQFWDEARKSWNSMHFSSSWWRLVIAEAISGSRIVVRWLLFGVLLASAIRGFVSLEDFQAYFGPTILGLGLTLLAATVIEVCSEGSTPIAADMMTRAQAPGNSFAFLMSGVATDYTEVMVIKDTMKSWKIALFLPLVTIPQVVLIALILNMAS